MRTAEKTVQKADIAEQCTSNTYQQGADLKTNIERILSDILSQKHDVKVTLRFEKKVPDKN